MTGNLIDSSIKSASENTIVTFSNDPIGYQHGVFYSLQENNKIKQQSQILLSTNNNGYAIVSIILASVAIWLSLLWVLYGLYILLLRRDRTATEIVEPGIRNQYQSIVFTNGIDLGNLLQNNLPIDYLITTHFVFTADGWKTKTPYINTVLLKKPSVKPRVSSSKVLCPI